MMTENDALMEIVHLASAALVADMTEVKRQALADIADAIAGLLPVDRTAKIGGEGAVGRDGCPQPSADPQGRDKFLTVAPGVKLVRFRGRDETRLVARRVGRSGNPNTIFEIRVDNEEKEAIVYRDDEPIFTLVGNSVGYSMVEVMAISALKRWCKENRRRNERTARKRKARLGILTPEQELARTVAEQKEGL